MPETRSTMPRLWLLTGKTTGDNNQLLALAEALGFPFEIKPLAYNQLRRIAFFRHDLTIVADESRKSIIPPWPDLVIGVGYGSVPVARYIRRQSGDRAKLVHIGNPRDRITDFDLHITTPQYSRAPAPNLLELLFPIGNPAKDVEPTSVEREWLRPFSRPRRLIAIGGPARHWRLDHSALARAFNTIRAKEPAGSVIVATSARTGTATRRLLSDLMGRDSGAIIDHFPRFGVLLHESDEIYVTADSVSMISEAILTGKPMGVVPIKRSLRGQISHLLWEQPFGGRTFPDFVNFWRLLDQAGLAGTVELPVASQVCDTVERAVDAVRSLFAAGDIIDGGHAPPGASDLGNDRRAGGRQRSGPRARGGTRASVSDQAARI